MLKKLRSTKGEVFTIGLYLIGVVVLGGIFHTATSDADRVHDHSKVIGTFTVDTVESPATPEWDR